MLNVASCIVTTTLSRTNIIVQKLGFCFSGSCKKTLLGRLNIKTALFWICLLSLSLLSCLLSLLSCLLSLLSCLLPLLSCLLSLLSCLPLLSYLLSLLSCLLSLLSCVLSLLSCLLSTIHPCLCVLSHTQRIIQDKLGLYKRGKVLRNLFFYLYKSAAE